MKVGSLLALLCLAAVPVQAQRASLDATLSLDTRTPLHIDSPYQRTDTVHTAQLQLHGTLDRTTTLSVVAQRKYFATRITQAQAERPLRGGASIRAGLLRAPFGIYDYEETYRSGLIDYPIPRVDYGANGVDFGVPGVGGTIARGRWQAEGALFSGRSVSVWNDIQHGSGATGRVQFALPPTGIVGVSHWSGEQKNYQGQPVSLSLTGLDLRYGRPYLMVRAEALVGRLAGARYAGEYADLFYRLPGLPAWTVAARGERLRPNPAYGAARQTTLGVRWTASPEWTFAVNWRANATRGRYPGSWVAQAPGQGAWVAQIYRTIPLR